MSDDPYGQRAQMEDPTMVGTLQAQADMIWPHEVKLLERLGFSTLRHLADLGCGTGRFANLAAANWPDLKVRGMDLFEPHLQRAQAEAPANATFEVGDARRTGWDAHRFDAVVLRHIVHALRDRDALYTEAKRLLRPGGLLYVLAEDYDGLIFDVPASARVLFHQATPALRPTGTDLDHGRSVFRDLRRMGLDDVRVEPLVIDTQNTPREPFARMLRYWRDGYASFIAEHRGVTPDAVRAQFDELIACVEDEERYACWLLFAATGVAPGE